MFIGLQGGAQIKATFLSMMGRYRTASLRGFALEMLQAGELMVATNPWKFSCVPVLFASALEGGGAKSPIPDLVGAIKSTGN